MCALYDYQVYIACLSEVKLGGTGSRNIKVPTADSQYWFYHSSPKTQGQQVVVALSLSANSTLLSWQSASAMITSVRFQSQSVNLIVVVTHAPAIPYDDKVEDGFEDSLYAVVN